MICRNRPNCRNWVRQSRFLQRTLLYWTVCRRTLQNCELIDAHSTLPKSASWRVWLCCLVEFWGWNAPASLWTGYFDWLTLNEDNIFAGAPVLCTFVLWTKFYSTRQHPLPPTSIHHLQIQTPRFSPPRSPFPPRQHHARLNRHIFWFGKAIWATTCWYWYPRRKINVVETRWNKALYWQCWWWEQCTFCFSPLLQQPLSAIHNFGKNNDNNVYSFPPGFILSYAFLHPFQFN